MPVRPWVLSLTNRLRFQLAWTTIRVAGRLEQAQWQHATWVGGVVRLVALRHAADGYVTIQPAGLTRTFERGTCSSWQ